MAAGKIIGDRVQYRLDSPVAVGAFSTVYRCTELSTGHAYAIKVIKKKVAADNHMKEALIREVNALEIAGSSPYVTTLVDKMVSKHNYYLVMELAEGGTLLDFIREQRQELRMLQASLSGCRDVPESLRSGVPPLMQYDRVQHFFKQLLLALSLLHDHNVVHRDVKPENILLNKRRTRLVLSDFGFACHAPPGTELHRACGTLRYCAPELLHENPRYDGRKVDVWAAGVTLYVMLFGGHPFRCPSQDPDSLLEVITTTHLRIPRPIPAEIEDILHHMLCVDPMERWSVKQLLQHPWIAALSAELLSPSVSAMSPAPSSSLCYEAAETVTEFLSDGCPPVDAIPSDEEVVDDGFYQSSSDDKQSSGGSSNSPTESGALTNRLTSSSPTDEARANPSSGDLQYDRADKEEATTVTTVNTSVAAASLPVSVLPSKDLVSAVRCTPAVVPVATALTKREVLQQGSVFTSMISIESGGDSEDERSTANRNGDAADIGGLASAVNATLMRSAARRASSNAISSVSTNNTLCDDGQPSFWWVRYAYGLYLTARILARFVGFFSLCIIAVTVRVVLKRDLVDLPLPEVVRNYISFLLSTPLRRSRLVQQQHLDSQSPSSSILPTVANTARPHTSLPASRPKQAGPTTRYNNMLPIPGSGLRHYVRTADQLVRDSFVGNAVLEHNASFADPQASLSLPSLASTPVLSAGGTSITSSPAAPSLATIAPRGPSFGESLVMGGVEGKPAMQSVHVHLRSNENDWFASDSGIANDNRPESRCNLRAQLAEESVTAVAGQIETESAATTAAAKTTAVTSACASPLVKLVPTASSLHQETVVTNASWHDSASTPHDGKHPGSQTGVTDTTGSGDSGEDKLANVVGSRDMLSPVVSPSPAFPCY